MLRRRDTTKGKAVPIELTLDHDGRRWVLSGDELCVAAKELDQIDRKLEMALQHRLDSEGRLEVVMRTNNTMIPEWMRPYMNHYFNRHLELPLRY